MRLMDFRYSIIPGVFTFTGMKKLNSFLKAGSPIHLIRMDGYPEKSDALRLSTPSSEKINFSVLTVFKFEQQVFL